jgi:hypothetical protein
MLSSFDPLRICLGIENMKSSNKKSVFERGLLRWRSPSTNINANLKGSDDKMSNVSQIMSRSSHNSLDLVWIKHIV